MAELRLLVLQALLLCCSNMQASSGKHILLFEVLAEKASDDGTVNAEEAPFNTEKATFNRMEATLSKEDVEKATYKIAVNLTTSLHECETRFLSIALGSKHVPNNWNGLHLGSGKLTNIASALAPCDLRLGGTSADFLIFDPNPNELQNDEETEILDDDSQFDSGEFDQPKGWQNYVVNGQQWEAFNGFVSRAGWDLLFDVNLFFWRPDGLWDSTNAELLLNYSSAKGIRIPYFQLGNATVLFLSNFHFKIEPGILLQDYRILKNLTSKYPLYADSKLCGPDVSGVAKSGGARNYYLGFVTSGAYDVVDAYSLHHYYLDGDTATLEDFLSVSVLESLRVGLEEAVRIARSTTRPLPVMLTETASCFGGGATGLSDAYVAGFLWLDKLGLCAQFGISRVFRQALFGGAYALIAGRLEPRPDYYLSVLYKRLIEGPVFNLTIGPSIPTLRVYAHCARRGIYNPGALVIYYLNLGAEDVALLLTQYPGADLDLYLLTPGDEKGLKSSTVKLNGQLLTMSGDDVPAMPPKRSKGKVTAQAQTFGFVVIPDANVQLCVNYYTTLDSEDV